MADQPRQKDSDSGSRMAHPGDQSVNNPSTSSVPPLFNDATELVEPTSSTSSAPANHETAQNNPTNQQQALSKPDQFEFKPPSDGKRDLSDEQPIELTTASQRLRTASGNSVTHEPAIKSDPDQIGESVTTSTSSATAASNFNGVVANNLPKAENEDDEEAAEGPSREFLLIRRPSYRKILSDLGGSVHMIPEEKVDPSISGSESSTSEDFSSAVSSSTPVSGGGIGGGIGGQGGGHVGVNAAAAHLSALSSGVIPPGVFQNANHVLSNSGTNSLTLSGSDPVHTFTMTANQMPPISSHGGSGGRVQNHGNGAHLIQYAQEGNSFLLPAALTAQGMHGMGHNGPSGLLGHSAMGNHHHEMSLSPTGSHGGHVGDDGGTRKREMRLMKNREAARECRRKKKEYIKCLENRVAVLENQNKALIEELKSLKELYTGKQQT